MYFDPSGHKTETSIVDYLKSQGEDSSFAARKEIAKELGIKNYTRTAEQNIQMLKSIQAQETKENKTTSTPKPTPKPTPKVTPKPTTTPQKSTQDVNGSGNADKTGGSNSGKTNKETDYTITAPSNNLVGIPNISPEAAFWLGLDNSARGPVMKVINIIDDLRDTPNLTQDVVDYNVKHDNDFNEKYKMGQVTGLGLTVIAIVTSAVNGRSNVFERGSGPNFPEDPKSFKPEGLITKEYKNGKIIKWHDPKTGKAIYEWNEDPIYGDHYHVTPDGKNRMPHPDCKSLN